MKNPRSWILLTLILSLAVSACGDGGAGTGDIATGEDLFSQTILANQAGCKTCHSLESGVVIVGPALAGIGTRAATTVTGQSAQEYLQESIVDPDAHVVEGYPPGTMPKTFGTDLTPDEIDSLVAYLLSLK